jgi:hypothetical protein
MWYEAQATYLLRGQEGAPQGLEVRVVGLVKPYYVLALWLAT